MENNKNDKNCRKNDDYIEFDKKILNNYTFSVDPEMIIVPDGFIAREYMLSLLPVNDDASNILELARIILTICATSSKSPRNGDEL